MNKDSLDIHEAVAINALNPLKPEFLFFLYKFELKIIFF